MSQRSKSRSQQRQRVVVVGGGARGCDRAVTLAAAGATVTLIVRRGETLPVDERTRLRRLGGSAVEVLFDREVTAIEVSPDESLCILADGSAYPADHVLVVDEIEHRSVAVG